MQEGSSQPLPAPPRVRPMDKLKVESLMKRRYSTRGVPAPPIATEPFPAELSSRSKAYESEREAVFSSRYSSDDSLTSQVN
jgi:hypothetical protein